MRRATANLLRAFWTVAAFTLAGLSPEASHAQQFRSPVACDDCINWFYYFDHDQGGGVQDWDCQDMTYDGHQGTDYSLSGGNNAIDDGYDVVAMADGVVVHSEDGYFDRCTSCQDANCGLDFGNGFANQVRIDHGDYTVIYGHMRTGSVLVAEGDVVTCGQSIGQIGSSGCSSGAHLHIEPFASGGGFQPAVDPYVGDCSDTVTSLFVSQGDHRGMPSSECADGGMSAAGGADGSGGASAGGAGGGGAPGAVGGGTSFAGGAGGLPTSGGGGETNVGGSGTESGGVGGALATGGVNGSGAAAAGGDSSTGGQEGCDTCSENQVCESGVCVDSSGGASLASQSDVETSAGCGCRLDSAPAEPPRHAGLLLVVALGLLGRARRVPQTIR